MSTRLKLIIAAVLCLLVAIGAVLAVNSSPSEQAGTTGTGTRVAFYGDSYTLGTGASDYANRWSTIISEERGWDEFNPSVNGLGFINNRTKFGSVVGRNLCVTEWANPRGGRNMTHS